MRTGSHALLRVRASGPARAFTLIEVLLALTLFAIAVIVLSAAYINVLNGIDNVKTDRAFDQELQWVRQQVLLEPDLTTVEKGGESESVDFGKVDWEVAVDPTSIADLFHVTLHITTEGKGDRKPQEATQQFMVLRPLWSDPVDREKLRNDSKTRLESERRDAGMLPVTGKK